jgi:DNA-binding CsgD family transcriptional regulator
MGTAHRQAGTRPLAHAARLAASLLRAQHSASALGILHEALAAMVPLSNFIVVDFVVDQEPVLVESNYEREYLLRHLAAYRSGLYQLDPFYPHVAVGTAGLLRLDAIAPENFRGSEYFLRHYKVTGVIDELRYLVPLGPGRAVHVFIEREQPLPLYSRADGRRLSDVEPFVRAFVEQHWQWRERHLAAASVTRREAFDLRQQIIEQMLKGHSAKSMAGLLGIEEGTVTNHKRNIYAKLGIHSQAQLFDRFLRTLSAR